MHDLWHTMDMKRAIAIGTLMSMSVLFLFHIVATVFYFYNSIMYFDKWMHALGGIVAAFFVAMVLFEHMKELRYRRVVIIILLSVFIIGLAWEYYEYLIQFLIKGSRLADIPDSITDMMCDMLGGVIGTCFVLIIKKRYNTR